MPTACADSNRPSYARAASGRESTICPAVVGAKRLGSQVQAVAYLWEAGRLRSSETESEKLEFPVPSLEDALVAFTTAAYGKPLRF